MAGLEAQAATPLWQCQLIAAGRAALDSLVTQQAQIVAYIDDYKLLLIATLALFGQLVIFKKSSGLPGGTAAVEG
ncbi:MAG: hypothetical protein WBB34_16460 [Xanthobacteraceae bacterium]